MDRTQSTDFKVYGLFSHHILGNPIILAQTIGKWRFSWRSPSFQTWHPQKILFANKKAHERIELLPFSREVNFSTLWLWHVFFIPMNLCEGFIVMNLMGLQFWMRMQEHFVSIFREFFSEFLLQRMWTESVQRSCIFFESYSINFSGTSLRSRLKDCSAKNVQAPLCWNVFFVFFVAKRLNNACFFAYLGGLG